MLLLGLLAAGAQWWLLREAERSLQRIAYQWQGYGTLRYERLWFNLWGTGVLYDVSFQPNGLMQGMLGTPLDYRISVGEVRIDDLDLGDDRSLQRVRLRLIDLDLPMGDGYRLRGRNAPPSLATLGYSSLRLQAALDVRALADGGLLLVGGDIGGDDSAYLRFDLQLDATPSQLARAPDQIGLRKLRLDFEDRGVMQRYQDRRAAELQVDREQVGEAIVRLLDQRARRERWRWDAGSAAALRSFVRAPGACRITLDPPDTVLLRNLNLYSVGDWPPLLGFRFERLPDAAPR